MSKNAKRAMFCIGIAIVLSAVLLLLPGLFIKVTPVAEEVSISKKEYQDIVTADGNILRDSFTNTVNVQMFITERDISKIEEGQRAEVTGDAFPDKTYSARITDIAPSASKVTAGSVTRTVIEVWAEIDGNENDDNEALKSGFTARVTIKIGEAAEKQLLPYTAVDQDENGEFVWVTSSGTAVKRYIITGEELPDGIEILGGLEPDDRIIKLPEGVTEGDRVDVTNDSESVSYYDPDMDFDKGGKEAAAIVS
jgi:hypothetical protein